MSLKHSERNRTILQLVNVGSGNTVTEYSPGRDITVNAEYCRGEDRKDCRTKEGYKTEIWQLDEKSAQWRVS